MSIPALACSFAACKKKEAGTELAEDAREEADRAAESDLIASDLKAPEGITFKKSDQAWGTLELPDGADWTATENGVEGKDGTVIMIQRQDDIGPDLMDEYLQSYNDVQTRDAPKYEKKAEVKGTVAGQPAARVEGAFDNGTRFVTRDYLLFAKGKVVLIGARTPDKNAANLSALVDYVVSTVQVK